jgi:D-3-phosphoglycerate dehydrogenase
MADFLLTGAVTNALNSPSISAEEAPKLKPFVALAEKLGAFAGQMIDADLKSINIAYEGEVSKLNVKPTTAAVLAGILRPMLAEINMVSAPNVARERGVTVTESRSEDSAVYDSLMRITVEAAGYRRNFVGTVIGGAPRIVEVEGIVMDAPLAPRMLYVSNTDKPGFVGSLGMLTGEAGVNIATFNLGRKDAGGEALALMAIDQPMTDAVLSKVRALPNVKEVRVLEF